MARKKIKLAWIENDNSRVIRSKKRREGLLKKIEEVTILCDVKACIIMFSPEEDYPMVWPSLKQVRDLLDDFFALPEIEKKKKETSLQSYLKEKTKKVHEQLMKTHKKNQNYAIDQMMLQLHRGRSIADLDLNEIYALISFSKDNVMLHRKKLHFVQHSPLRDPPDPLFERKFEEFETTTNGVFARGRQEDERAWNTNEAMKEININAAIPGNQQSCYLIDQWFPFQGNNINGLEMEPIGAPVISFHGLVGSVSQPLQHHNTNNNPTMAMSQPNQCPFDFMNPEFGVKDKGSIVNNGDSQFQRRSNTIEISNDIRRESPAKEATDGEDNDMM
ncbi:PREDICTED: floral homeotic protein PMADS 1-like [Camelina sativa]|uniref:Floral homeotic protein PMADS 1-like n=1 Tax=Camelina sativa TaxID=90675 RepID=A0ABM1RCN1_CAMSA|nr:PREDICTED: floral homeotic protein PMADS 1-like [Camelina sativa]